MPHKVVPRGLFNPTPLGRRYGLERVLTLIAGPRLDLNEHQLIAISSDQIDLAGSTAKVPRQHPMTGAAQRTSDQALTGGTEGQMIPTLWLRPTRPTP